RADFRVSPLVGHALDLLVRIGVIGHANAGIEPIKTVVDLGDRLSCPEKVVSHPYARRDAIPLYIVVLAERRIRRAGCRRHVERTEAVGQLLLIGRPEVVMVPPSAKIEGRAAYGVLIGKERVVCRELIDSKQIAVGSIAKAAHMGCCRGVEKDLVELTVARDVFADVSGCHLRVPVPSRLEQHLTTELEVMGAAPAVLEVRDGAGRLASLAIGLLFLI